jgi:hypothetical protein
MTRVPVRYVPRYLTRKDKKKAKNELKKSRNAYKKKKYYTRKKVKSFKSVPSKHIRTMKKMYGTTKINKVLAHRTGCSIKTLNSIVRKGMGAYFSSGSRPNQTAHSWGIARLASSVTGGKSSGVDYKLLKKGCTRKSKALKLAKTVKKGMRRVPKIKL